VEVVRRVNEAFDARDTEALVAADHSDVEIVVLRSDIEGPYRGHDGLRRMATDAFEVDMEIRIELVLREVQSAVGVTDGSRVCNPFAIGVLDLAPGARKPLG
jgi:hypothetical protein